MKLIQALEISEGMSMNSLKPSINSGPDSSLETCMIKDSPVDDGLLPKDKHEKHFQNNGPKDICLTDCDVGKSGNSNKKMFEQVDLNSGLPIADAPLRKDSWNSGTLFNKSSEKENMVESNEVTFDILSDDESETFHLKLSSDEDENSNEDLEDQNNTSSKQVHASSEDDPSKQVTDHDTSNDEICKVVEITQPNNLSKMKNEIPNGILDKENNTDISLKSDNRTDISPPDAVELAQVDTEGGGGPVASSSKALQPLETESVSKTKEIMVDETKSNPASPTPYSPVSSDPNAPVPKVDPEDCLEEESSKETEKDTLIESSDLGSRSEASPIEDLSDKDSSVSDQSAGYTFLSGENNIVKASSSELDSDSNTNVAIDSKTLENSEEDVICISDDAIDSDNCGENAEGDGIEVECNEQSSSAQVSDDDCEKAEESCNDESQRDTEISDPEQEVGAEKDELNGTEKGEDESMDLDMHVDGSLSEENDKESVEGLMEPAEKEEGGKTEKNFLEIIEYQPTGDDVECLNESDPDKDTECNEEQQTTLQSSEHEEKLSEPTESDEKQSHGVESDQIHNDDLGADSGLVVVTSTVLVPTSSSAENIDNLTNRGKPSEKDEVEVSLGPEKNTNDFVKSNEDSDANIIECGDEERDPMTSGISTGRKADSVEVQSSRKRISPSTEDKLVKSSKRTKVVAAESETSSECDVLVCEDTVTNSGSEKRGVELNTKEKSENRVKRQQSPVEEVEAKKVCVMPGLMKEIKDVEKKSVDSVDVKNCDSTTDTKKGNGEAVKIHPLPAARKFALGQMESPTQNDLEEVLIQKILECVADRAQCGEIRELATSLDQKLKLWQKKAHQLTKQVKDLTLVMKRYGSDLQNKGPNAIPVKITRSVGLQVQMPGSSSGVAWSQEDSARRKGEKSQPSVAPASSATPVNNSPKMSATSPVSKSTVAPTASKHSESGDASGASAAMRQQSQANCQSVGVKVLPTRSPVISSSGPANVSKTNNKQSLSSFNNRLKASPDLQVIDLTDAEDKARNSVARSSAASTSSTTSVSTTPVASTTVTSTVGNAPVTSVGCRSIRVVQQLAGTSAPALITQSGPNTVAGQRLAYFVPTTSVPVPQRQLIISSASQVRPAGAMTVSHRQNPIPTIVLKPGQVVPVSSVQASGANIVRTSSISNSIQLSSPRMQPRAGQLLQRIPATPSPTQSSTLSVTSVSHPAPLPPVPLSAQNNINWKLPPPKPDLKISKGPNRNQQGIVLSWNMSVTQEYEEIASYQLFAYQEGNAPPSSHLWKKVGDVKALPLPMACTLTQFMEGHKYHFAVRAVDVHARYGPFSAPGNIVLTRN